MDVINLSSGLCFQKNAMDPKRFNNRGGGLLQEEQERKKLLTKLPKVGYNPSSSMATGIGVEF